MTLVLAIRCTDGVVIGADSASSDPETGTRQPVEKLARVGDLPIVYGGSGDAGLLQKIDDNLAALTPWADLKGMCRHIQTLVVPELRNAAQNFVAYPQMNFNLPPTAILLFAGVLNGEPFVLEIERNGGDTFYDDRLGNFAAIGSGKVLAQALFRPHLTTERDLELGKHFAYRVLDDAIEMSAMYLARPIHLRTVSLDGTVHTVEDAEMAVIKNWCEGWRQLEREAVEDMLTGGWEQPGADIPRPE